MPSTRWTVVVGLLLIAPAQALGQPNGDFVPVTDAMLQDPAPADWLMWRRTLDSWGYSPLVYDGVMYMPNPRDVIQAIDAATGDLIWEYRRQRPDDLTEFIPFILAEASRNIAIYDNLIIDTSNDGWVFALDATTGRLVWET